MHRWCAEPDFRAGSATPSWPGSTGSGVRYRCRVTTDVVERTEDLPDPLDAVAEPVSCVRCSTGALLTIVGRCADCISDMGRNHPDEREAWKRELTEAIESRGE